MTHQPRPMQRTWVAMAAGAPRRYGMHSMHAHRSHLWTHIGAATMRTLATLSQAQLGISCWQRGWFSGVIMHIMPHRYFRACGTGISVYTCATSLPCTQCALDRASTLPDVIVGRLLWQSPARRRPGAGSGGGDLRVTTVHTSGYRPSRKVGHMHSATSLVANGSECFDGLGTSHGRRTV